MRYRGGEGGESLPAVDKAQTKKRQNAEEEETITKATSLSWLRPSSPLPGEG